MPNQITPDLTSLQVIVETVIGPLEKALAQEDALTDMEGWDSMAALRVMVALEKQFGVKLPVHEFFQAQTVSELQSILQHGH